mmetsp:Transcript_23482/g.34801  ORF Transcript_23482/g.34801 Transcript_23482/m.34801 type:complete len:323 (+) Transcript_23482:65-1033(+)
MDQYVNARPDNVERAIDNLWIRSTQNFNSLDPEKTNWKQQTLPLARIKKIMKSDEVVYLESERESNIEHSEAPSQNARFMIAGEAPILLGKACEMLVKELSIRAWKHTERNRRRTLQKQDVHAAVGESEVYDFLIDIVPRVQMQPAVKGFSSPIPEPVQQAARLTSSIVNEIPTINHAPQVHAPTAASGQGAHLQLQQMMPAQIQASHQSQLQQMMPQAQIQAQSASHQPQLQQMIPQAQMQAQYTIMQQQQLSQPHQHDSGNHQYHQHQDPGSHQQHQQHDSVNHPHQQQQQHHQQQHHQQQHQLHQQYIGHIHNIEGGPK